MKYVIEGYKPRTVPKSIEFKESEKGTFKLKIGGVTAKVIPEYLGGARPDLIKPICITTKKKCECILEEFMSQRLPYPYIIKNFTYNGFTGKLVKGVAPYKAAFIKWTGDPGIASMKCSDGKTRLIPTFALNGGGFSLPYDDTKDKRLFGMSCQS